MQNLMGNYTALEIALLLDAIYKDAVNMNSDDFERKLRTLLDEDFRVETLRIINHNDMLVVKLMDQSVLSYKYRTTKVTLFLP